MLRKLGLPLMCLAMFSIAGGHLAVLQGVAWAGMFWSYSRDASFTEAAEKTFSGEYPCSMCKKVAKARQQEEKAPAALKVDKKAETFLFVETGSVCLPECRDFSFPPIVAERFWTRAEAPPIPVPIFVLA